MAAITAGAIGCDVFLSGCEGISRITAGKRKRPNILLAIADDASWPDMSAYGCKFVHTPAFDSVAKRGILFNHCFTTNPKCSPSRATILTGLNTWQLEDACDHFGIFPAKFPVYTNMLEEAGYYVGYTGKGWAPGSWRKGGFKRNPAGVVWNKIRCTPPTRGISNVDYAANFDAFLKSKKPGQPFCFWYGGFEPHRGYEWQSGIKKGGKNINDVTVAPFLPDSDIVKTDYLDYAYEIEWFDKHLGKILRTLEQAGELNNTLILVTGDNGKPFPRIKGQIYEDDFHLPLAACWVDRFKGGRVVDDFISFSDFAPTFLEATGVKTNVKMTGKSFLDVLLSNKSGQVDKNRDMIIVGKERHDIGRPHNWGYPVRAIRTEDYLYVRNFKPDRWPAGNPQTGYTNIDPSPTKKLILQLKQEGKDKYWKYAMGKRPAEELYYLIDDPHCMKNLADNPKYAGIKKKLWSRMYAILVDQKDPRVLGHGDVFDNYEYVGNKSHSWDAWMKRQKNKIKKR